jgi:hypothetical protein
MTTAKVSRLGKSMYKEDIKQQHCTISNSLYSKYNYGVLGTEL